MIGSYSYRRADHLKEVGPSVISSQNSKNLDTSNTENIKIAGKILKVDLASTPETQEQGLSGRSGLEEDSGMLFIFDNPGKYAFWMKDMNFPIDMIWIGEDLSVIYIKENATPESYPGTFVSNKDAKYVLEVNALFSKKNNLKVGDKMEFLSS